MKTKKTTAKRRDFNGENSTLGHQAAIAEAEEHLRKLRARSQARTVVENQTATCFCGRKGEYTGCSPAGSSTGPLRVAFKCGCGKVWGFLIPRADLEKYRT